MVEHATVNRRVAGSSPARGAEKKVEVSRELLPFFVSPKANHQDLCLHQILNVTGFTSSNLKLHLGIIMEFQKIRNAD
jgi:hypothetical protein